MNPIETAPKDRLILLFVPEFGCSTGLWWTGLWQWSVNKWGIKSPFTVQGKQVIATDIPCPIGWAEFPER